MEHLSVADKCRVIAAWLLVKCKLLKHDDFSETELNGYLVNLVPYTLDVDVPVGNAVLTILSATLQVNSQKNKIEILLQCSFAIDLLSQPIYRTHVDAVISAEVGYAKPKQALQCSNVTLDQLRWIDDDYTLVSDTRQFLDKVSPISLLSNITHPLKSLINTVTGGLSDASLHYLQSFTNANKQTLLDEHKPRIERAILRELAQHDLTYSMSKKIWREYLFRQLGSHVSIENKHLRFWLS